MSIFLVDQALRDLGVNQSNFQCLISKRTEGRNFQSLKETSRCLFFRTLHFFKTFCWVTDAQMAERFHLYFSRKEVKVLDGDGLFSLFKSFVIFDDQIKTWACEAQIHVEAKKFLAKQATVYFNHQYKQIQDCRLGSEVHKHLQSLYTLREQLLAEKHPYSLELAKQINVEALDRSDLEVCSKKITETLTISHWNQLNSITQQECIAKQKLPVESLKDWLNTLLEEHTLNNQVIKPALQFLSELDSSHKEAYVNWNFLLDSIKESWKEVKDQSQPFDCDFYCQWLEHVKEIEEKEGKVSFNDIVSYLFEALSYAQTFVPLIKKHASEFDFLKLLENIKLINFKTLFKRESDQILVNSENILNQDHLQPLTKQIALSELGEMKSYLDKLEKDPTYRRKIFTKLQQEYSDQQQQKQVYLEVNQHPWCVNTVLASLKGAISAYETTIDLLYYKNTSYFFRSKDAWIQTQTELDYLIKKISLYLTKIVLNQIPCVISLGASNHETLKKLENSLKAELDFIAVLDLKDMPSDLILEKKQKFIESQFEAFSAYFIIIELFYQENPVLWGKLVKTLLNVSLSLNVPEKIVETNMFDWLQNSVLSSFFTHWKQINN